MTFADAADELGAVAGHPVRYVPASPEEFAAGLIEAGFPAEVAAPVSELFAEVLDGRNSYLTDGVQRALGRPSRDFADYARTAAASGVWNTERAAA